MPGNGDFDMHHAGATHHVLWTGGWDSTFRVLQLATADAGVIQPYYLLFKDRASSSREKQAVHEIRALFEESHPEAAGRVRQPETIEVDTLAADRDIEAALQALQNQGELGDQYSWLSRFSHQYGINGLELSIHLDDKAAAFVTPYARRCTGHDSFELVATAPEPLRVVFGRFRFPLLQRTKRAMDLEARALGITPHLDRTWFCHWPTKFGQPCGTCHPCRYTMEEGLSRRIPITRRALYHVNRSVNYLSSPIPKGIRRRIIRVLGLNNRRPHEKRVS